MSLDARANFNQYDALGRPMGTQGILASMDRHGVENSVLISSLAVDSDFRLGNRELFDIIKANDRLYGYCTLNPHYQEESIQLMRGVMNSRKFVAIALFHGASRPYPNLDDYRDILNAYRRFSKPVFVHTPHAEAVAAAEQMAKEFANVKFIFGSMGGDDWKRAMLSVNHLNVMYETSGSFDAEKIETAVATLGAHRLLYGSDMPFSDPISMLALIKGSSITADAVNRITDANARKLFNIPKPSEAAEEQEQLG